MRKNLLVVIILFSFVFNVKFIKAETKKILTRTTYDNIYFVENGLPEHYMSDIQFHLSFDGRAAFCLDPKLQIKGYSYFEYPLSKASYDTEILNYLKKVIYYGYDYENHGTPRYYMATQALIWEKLSPYVIEFYTQQYGYGNYIDVSKEKNEILSLANSHEDVPYFANKSYNYNLVSNLEFKDELLREFEITHSNYSNVKMDNNKLKIDNLDGFIGTINIKLKKKTYRNDEAKYYYLDGSQPMMTGGKLDDLVVNLSINITGAKIKLNKLDSDSNLLVKNSNTVFNIKNINTNEYVYLNGTKDLKINENGYLITDYLPYGTYEIKEIKTENGYKLNNNSKIIELNEKTKLNNGILGVKFYNEKELGKLELTKVDNISKNKIPNVEFELYSKEDIVTKDGVTHYKKGKIISTKKTDSNGKIVFDNLILGNYCIKEISAPKDYKLNIEEHCFNLYENKNSNVTIENELKRGSIEIKKYGEVFSYLENKYSFNLLENIEFELYANENVITSDGTIHYKKNEVINTKKTDGNGIITFDNLILGNYCIREKYTNNNYIKNDKEYCFNLHDNINQSIEVYNYLKKVNLKINKLDIDSKLNIKNSNIVFSVKNVDTNEYIYLNNQKDLKISEEGHLIINDLPYGTYELEEIKTEKGYKLNKVKEIIEINDNTDLNNNTLEINFYNEKELGKIKITKYGEVFNYLENKYSFNLLENIEFELYANENVITSDGTIHYKKNEVINTKKTDENGIITFDNLILGNYCIREKYTNNNYIKNDKEYCFNLHDNINQSIEIYNYLKKVDLKINKLDIDSKLNIKNSNIVFSVKNVDTNEYIYLNNQKDLNINKEGYLIINNLPYGIYELEEIKTEKGYKLNNVKEIIEINDNTDLNNNTLEINFFNEKELGKIQITKYGEVYNYLENKYGFKLLENMEFEIYANENIITKDGIIHYKKDEVIDIKKTDENGIIIFDNLILGNYCIKEKYTNSNYNKNEKEYCFNIYDENEVKVEVYNYLKKVNLKINKLDIDSNLPIKNSNIIFNIQNIDTNEYIYLNNQKDLKINEEGYLIIKDLPYGNYELEEIKTEKGYKLNNKKQIIEINDNTVLNNNTLEINFYNEKELGKIQITKIDNISKHKIPNVEFELYSKEDIVTKDGIIHYKKGEIISTNKTDKNGVIIFDNLILGKYCIKETSVPIDYKLNTEEYCFDLYENKINNITIENELKKGSLEIKKYGEEFNYITREYSFMFLENIEFEIYAKEDIITSDGTMHYKKDEVIDTKKTDKDGIIIFDNLILGNYCIREKNIDEKYINDNKEYCFNLYDNNDSKIEVFNYLKKSNLKIIKIDSITNNPLDNVEFEIFHNEQSLGKYITNKEGIIELHDLPVSIYEIKELVTKEGYILNETNHTIDLNLNAEIIIENDKIITIPNAMKNDYTNLLASTIYIFGIVLFIYEKCENN